MRLPDLQANAHCSSEVGVTYMRFGMAELADKKEHTRTTTTRNSQIVIGAKLLQKREILYILCSGGACFPYFPKVSAKSKF